MLFYLCERYVSFAEEFGKRGQRGGHAKAPWYRLCPGGAAGVQGALFQTSLCDAGTRSMPTQQMGRTGFTDPTLSSRMVLPLGMKGKGHFFMRPHSSVPPEKLLDLVFLWPPVTGLLLRVTSCCLHISCF